MYCGECYWFKPELTEGDTMKPTGYGTCGYKIRRHYAGTEGCTFGVIKLHGVITAIAEMPVNIGDNEQKHV